MVRTALEDVWDDDMIDFNELLCPELSDIDELLANNGNFVISLFEKIVSSQENKDERSRYKRSYG
eukprot:TRINITY_DN29753_c0_g1_i1.p1 TRINITY_DN29753_c0_g1~~TRINITY_DN29753_c0_g1_i1.p1  ORF type:complete len:65 (-),score=3.43 TRINITY_DN29753_c0_g1_i1:9-203(-)